MPGSFQRMLQLVTEFFDTKSDPEQISMTEEDREKLAALHPATMSEYADEEGPIVWILMIPTMLETMHRFIDGAISEQQLLKETPVGLKYEAIYLCSASVLPEYRLQGLAEKVTLEAVSAIRGDNPIQALCTWPFSKEGEALARAVARESNLPLYERKH